MLKDGRKSIVEVAKEIQEPKEEVYKQYQELKKAEIIKGATIHINYKSFGYMAVATILINVDPQQTDQLIEYVHKMPDIYSVHNKGPKGNVVIVTILKTLRQLSEVKERIRERFSISELRTTIWTDIKEMNNNLKLNLQNPMETTKKLDTQKEAKKISYSLKRHIIADEIDAKIAEKLAENGRSPMEKIAQETGLSTIAATRRYQKLKKNGILKVTIQIDPQKIGYQAIVIVFVTLRLQEDSFSIIEELSRIPDIISIMKTSGDYDLQIYAMIRDIDHLLTIQDEIAKIRGITKMDLEISRTLDKWPTPRQCISTF